MYYCRLSGEEDSALYHLLEMHKHNVLQTLLSAFVRCAAWPEVELPVSRAIAHLVALEDECDWHAPAYSTIA